MFVLAPNPKWNWTQSTKTQDDFERFCDFFFCLFFMFLLSTLKKLVSFLYINVQEFFPYMKSLQPQIANPRFWPLLSLTFNRKWSRVFAIAFSLNFKSWITLAEFNWCGGYILKGYKIVETIYDLYQSMVTATFTVKPFLSSHWEIFPCVRAPSEPNPRYFSKGSFGEKV